MPSRRSRPFPFAVGASMPVYRHEQHGEDAEKEKDEGEGEGHGFRLSLPDRRSISGNAPSTLPMTESRITRLSPLRRSSDGGYGCGAPPHVGHLTGTFSSAGAGWT